MNEMSVQVLARLGCIVVVNKAETLAIVGVFDGSLGRLCRANDSNATQHGVGRERIHNRALDVETVLQQNDGSTAGRDSRSNHLSNRGRDICNILCGDNPTV